MPFRSLVFRILLPSLVCLALPATAQIVVQNGLDIDMTGSTGSKIVFPDGTNMGSAAGVAPADHGGTSNTVSGTDSFVGGGSFNIVNDHYGAISGGRFNTTGISDGNAATGQLATVGGGYLNWARGTKSTVGGGESNTASGYNSAIGGGDTNTASGSFSTISGGDGNTASASSTTVGGGRTNTANIIGATVGGGLNNTASGAYAMVGGGQTNTASGARSMVVGGVNNTAAGTYSFAAGRQAKANHTGAFVWADGSIASDFASTTSNQFSVRSTNGVRFITNTAGTAGVALVAGGTSWAMVSAKEFKENKRALDPVAILDKLAALPIEEWNYTHQDESIKHIGPYAEDFYEAFELNGIYNGRITTQDLDGVAFAAIQGLNQKLDDKQEEIDRLTERLEFYDKQFESFEQRLLDMETTTK